MTVSGEASERNGRKQDDRTMAVVGFSAQEERLNALTHAAGAILSVVGLVWLMVQAGSTGRTGSLAVSAVYGSALVLLYTFSAAHHAVSRPRAKQFFLALDHCGIYLLIAGTYTPFFLIMPPGQGWLMLSFVWGTAAVGIAFQLIAFIVGKSDEYERFAFVLYLAMGWAPLLWVSDDVSVALAPVGLTLLLAGGIAYSFGVIFYLWKTLFHNHAIWHLFVIAGSTLQYFSILCYVVPGPS